MPFEPINDRHAITEVDFGLLITPKLTWDDRTKIRDAHSTWSALLPGIKEDSAMAVAMLDPKSNEPPPPPPISFERYKPSGGLDWRLRLAGGHITVNCLAYSRWQNIWDQTRQLFADVASVLDNPDRSIASIVLQYTDIFRWQGDVEDYRLDALLKADCPHISKTAIQHGPLWHSHHGWFLDADSSSQGRYLRRMHISGIREQDTYLVKMENLVHLFFQTAKPSMHSESVLMGVHERFNELHDMSKRILAEYLTDEMIERIDLHAAPA